MLDGDIRSVLKSSLRGRDNTAAIIDELPLLRGRSRADLAFVNGEFCGYEIKSDADSLARLGTQADYYQCVFEFITLVAARKHLKHARRRIPPSWGIIEAQEIDGKVTLTERRKPRRNYHINNSALVRILWKRECLRILSKWHISLPAHTPVRDIWKLMESLPSPTLCDEVREALKLRYQIIGTSQTQCDGLHTTVTIELVPQDPRHHRQPEISPRRPR
jgi:hypothetical protein